MTSGGEEEAAPNPPRATNWQDVNALWAGATSGAQFDKVKGVVAVLTSVAAAYVLGGVVLGLRLEQAHYPVEDGLRVIPPSVILVTGIVELVISALVGLILVAIVLGSDALLTRAFDKQWTGFVALGFWVAVLVLFVPLNAGGLAWPVALIVLGLALWLMKWKRSSAQGGWAPPLWLAVSLVVVVVAGVTLARYTVPPFRFANGEVSLKPEPGVFKEGEKAFGGYLGQTSDYVYLASSDDPDTEGGDEGRVVGYAQDDVAKIDVSPHPPPELAPHSLVEVIFGWKFAVTPIGDVWDGDNYEGWRLVR